MVNLVVREGPGAPGTDRWEHDAATTRLHASPSHPVIRPGKIGRAFMATSGQGHPMGSGADPDVIHDRRRWYRLGLGLTLLSYLGLIVLLFLLSVDIELGLLAAAVGGILWGIGVTVYVRRLRRRDGDR